MALDKLAVYQTAARFLADARFALITDDVETRHAFDTAWERAVTFVLEQAPWRFAMITTALSTTTGPVGGYSTAFSRPADWLRTHAIFVLSGAVECPVDLREQGIKISANVGALSLRYVSSNFADPALANNPWPEHFGQLVAAYLAFLCAYRVTGDAGAPGQMSDLFSSLLPEAVRLHAVPEDRWLPHQRSGAMLLGARDLLKRGFWRFAMVTSAAVSGGTPAGGYTDSFVFPADWLRTHRLYVTTGNGREFPFDVREHDTHWSANIDAFATRYVSTIGLGSTLWPEPFRDALLAFLEEGPGRLPDSEGKDAGGSFPLLLASALDAEADPPDPWLEHQLSGRFLRVSREIAERANWRFALKEAAITVESGTPVSGLANSFAQPADWLRTYKLFSSVGGREHPIDIREVAGFWSTNAASFVAQYVSETLALDSLLWPEPFADAVLAYLQDDAPDEDGRVALWREHFADALVNLAEPDDRWLKHQLSGRFLSASREVLDEGFWRFAIKTASASAGGTPAPGFSDAFVKPADWLRTHRLFGADLAGREFPFDVREHDTHWSANRSAFTVRYVADTSGLNSTLWGDLFKAAVLARLEEDDAKDGSEAYRLALEVALKAEADPPDPWLEHQLSGRFLRVSREIAERANWRFALREAAITVESGTPVSGLANSFAQPADWLRTYKLFSSSGGREHPIDIREVAGFWSTNAASFVAQYVSEILALNSELWPQPYADAVLAYLQDDAPDEDGRAALWREHFADALANLAEPDDPWLRHQLSGRFLHASYEVLRQGFWRFAIKTVAASSGGTPATGYANAFTFPADWLRTHRLYSSDNGKESPFDIREHDTHWSTNRASFVVRYVANTGLNSVLWPEQFTAAVLARLQDEVAGKTGKEGETYPAALALALASDSDTPDVWLTAQLDGTFLRLANAMRTRAFWRFAMRTVLVDSGSSAGDGGYLFAFPLPDDWQATRQLYRLAGGRRMPFDIRERGGEWQTSVGSFYAEYVSETVSLDASLWPQAYKRAVETQLRFERDPQAAEKEAAIWKDTYDALLMSEAVEPDPWLPYQLSGAFLRGSRAVLGRGYWSWALKEAQYDQSDSTGTPDAGFPFRYVLPADHMRTHALFVANNGQEFPINIRETAQDWSTDAGDLTPPSGSLGAWTARYLSSSVLDATGGADVSKSWPELVARAVLAYLDWEAAPAAESKVKQQEFDRLLDEALAAHSRPENDWLRFQLDGSYPNAVMETLERGRWRFGIETDQLTAAVSGAISDTYSYRYVLPAGWMKTIEVYHGVSTAPPSERVYVDYRDEGGALHANYSPISIRYINRTSLESTRWPAMFRDAVLALLQHWEVRSDPSKTAIAKAKLDLFERQLREAALADDRRERPLISQTGRIARSRMGGGSGFVQQQGWRWP